MPVPHGAERKQATNNDDGDSDVDAVLMLTALKTIFSLVRSNNGFFSLHNLAAFNFAIISILLFSEWCDALSVRVIRFVNNG